MGVDSDTLEADLSSLAAMLRSAAGLPDDARDVEAAMPTRSALALVRRLGAGGMGVVYLARDRRLRRVIARGGSRSRRR